jgi:hypothetical protein
MDRGQNVPAPTGDFFHSWNCNFPEESFILSSPCNSASLLTYLYLFAPKKIKKWILLILPWLPPASFANLSNYSRVGIVKLYNTDRARFDAYPFTFRPVLKGYSREYYISDENRQINIIPVCMLMVLGSNILEIKYIHVLFCILADIMRYTKQ